MLYILVSHQSATSVWTTCQYRPDTHQCLENSNSSRLHPYGRHGNMFGCSSEFDKKSNFLHRHRYGKTGYTVRTLSFDKVRRGEELQPSGRQGNTVRKRSLLWKLRAAEMQPSRRGPNMVLREACYGKPVAQLSVWTTSAYVLTPPRENRISVDLGLL